MRRRGWFRLWFVLTLIGVPAAAEWNFQQEVSAQRDQDAITTKLCVDEEFNSPTHPDSFECGRKAGMFKSMFEREHTTAGRYWSISLAFFFAVDLVLTALLLGGFFAIRWIVRGFRDNTDAVSL